LGFWGHCPICDKNKLITLHHKFPQTKYNIAYYPEFIHNTKNIQNACIDCHLCKKKGLIIWNEMKFCDVMQIRPRSIIGLAQWERIKRNEYS